MTDTTTQTMIAATETIRMLRKELEDTIAFAELTANSLVDALKKWDECAKERDALQEEIRELYRQNVWFVDESSKR